jgi:3-dehydroquinate synthase
MVMAARLSHIDEVDRDRLEGLIDKAGLPVRPPSVGAGKLQAAMGMDKKVLAQQLRFVLLNTLGDAYVTPDYDREQLAATLKAAD